MQNLNCLTTMKKRFNTNTDGLGLCNRSVMNEDRITELPDALILQILSSLPTKTAIVTSVLSKRWKSLWKMVSELKFDCYFHQIFDDPHVFSENVYKTLNLHKAPVLESLHLIFQGRTEHSDVGIWIATAFAHRVHKLVLDSVYDDDEHTVILPSVLFSYNDTLETLELEGAIHLEFPSRVCLKSLRKLYLYGVHFKDDESVCNLLCGCPCLEDLVVHRYCDGEGTFTIAVPSLQRLTIEDRDPENHFGVGGYVINAPALKYLDISGFSFHMSCLIEKAPELVEAKISDVSYIINENILESLTSAKRLFLNFSPLKITVPAGNIFNQLVCLELHTHERKWWNLLSVMLDSSPKLQILKLTSLNLPGEDHDDQHWDPPKRVPECLLFHLETFVWKGYEWQRGDEKEVATYILESARQLKKATFATKCVDPGNPETLERRREMLNELAGVGRASNSCHLVFDPI